MEDEQTGTWIPYEYSRLTNIYNPPILLSGYMEFLL